ncbi:hypothetical protein DRE_01824 [Drechslerella stenobrocha 248]|uniref:Glycine cleavage system H protein n=1 Tax=Drechslerella stenobrocha 248 TaxID=1043628 RepID=W7I958_9PEZI|nr:hypothetical protein DRE_01824 [Drechslerella stenobrocha 248]
MASVLRIASRVAPRRLPATCTCSAPLRRTVAASPLFTPPSVHRQFSRTAMQLETIKRYTDDHEWVVLDTDTGIATVGITNYAQNSLGEVVFIELPEEGREIEVGESLGAVESVKSASDIISPVSGIIAEVNSELAEKPSLVNKDPEGGAGWIAKIEVGPEGLEGAADSLMDEETYIAFTTSKD